MTKNETKELKDAIRMLMDACNELMSEFVSRKGPADWSVINDAMLAGSKALKL